jgi:hypothetical protein
VRTALLSLALVATSLACGKSATTTPSDACGPAQLDCLGSACIDGMCAPTVLASTNAIPVALTRTSSFVAWLGYDGTLGVIPLDGGASTSVSLGVLGNDSAYHNVHGLGSTGDTAFAAFYYSAQLFEIPLPTGTPEQLIGTWGGSGCSGDLLTACTQVSAVTTGAVGADDIFFATAGATPSIWKLPRAGGPPTVLATDSYYEGAGILEVATDATHVYWAATSGQTLESAPLAPIDGGAASPFATTPSTATFSGDLAIDATYAYAVASSLDGTQAASIERVPLGGGTRTTLAQGSIGDTPCGLAVSGSSLYWTTEGHGLKRLALGTAGATPVTLLASGDPQLPCNGIAIDESYVYVNTLPATAEAGTANLILRLPK